MMIFSHISVLDRHLQLVSSGVETW